MIKSMQVYDEIKYVYTALQDDISRMIFCKRLDYSLSGRKKSIFEMVDEELMRNGPKDIMWRLLRWLENHSGEITVFGAGFAGFQICTVLHRYNIKINSIADNNEYLWGSTQENGITIIPPRSIKKDNIVIIGVNSCVEDIFQQLLSMGIDKECIFVPDKQWWIGENPQYFDLEIIRPEEEEIFVDGGSLDGSDSFNFIKWCKDSYKAIYAFEPDNKNYKNLYEFAVNHRNTYAFEEALWSDEKTLRFLSDKAENSAVATNGDKEVNVTSIDKKLAEEKVTYIKMDIEGSEMEALTGSANTIRKYKPKLAICVYHRPEDIIEIPRKILQLNSEYKFYLRHYSYVDTETVLYAI